MNRIPVDVWEVDEEMEGDLCARCSRPLDPGDVQPEVLRCVALAYGGLAVQAVAVHRSCWEEGRGEANLFLAAHCDRAMDGWEEMLSIMREQVDERRREDQEGEEWKG